MYLIYWCIQLTHQTISFFAPVLEDSPNKFIVTPNMTRIPNNKTRHVNTFTSWVFIMALSTERWLLILQASKWHQKTAIGVIIVPNKQNIIIDTIQILFVFEIIRSSRCRSNLFITNSNYKYTTGKLSTNKTT